MYKDKQFVILGVPGRHVILFLSGVLVLYGLYLISRTNYLLFHGLIEIFSIAVACSIFLLFWNSRRFLDDGYYLFIGIASLCVGGIDLLHALAYKGMGVFPGYDANLPTQLWIAARYTQSLSFLAAPLFLRRRLRPGPVLFAYALILCLLLGSIFYWGIFPDCYVEGTGLTPFKKVSECIISIFLVASIGSLFHKRRELDAGVFRLLVASIVVTIASELAFTFYISVYGLSNLVGHLLRVVAFYLTYRAFIEVGLTEPYALLFRDLKQSEEALRESEEMARALLNAPTDVAVMIDTTGIILDANETMASRIDKPVGELVGLCIWDLFPPDVVEHRKARIEQVAHSGKPVRFEESRLDTWYDTVIYPILDAQSKITKFAIIARDITQRKRAEQKLQEREETLRALLNATTESVLLVDVEETILALNKVAAQRLGKTVEEMIGQNVSDHLPPASAKSRLAYAPEIIRTGKPVRFQDERAGRTFNSNVYPIFDQGKVTAFAIYSQDVTEAREAEEALRQSEERFRALVQNSSDLISVFDPDGRVRYQSPALEQMLGYTEEDIVGSKWLELVHPDDLPSAMEALTGVLEEPGCTVSAELRYRHSDGSWHWVEVTCSNLLENPAVAGLVANSRDITQRKQAEERIRAALREKEVLLQEIHHRVKNNLQLISSLLDLQSAATEDSYALRVLQESQNRVRSMALVHERLYESQDLTEIDLNNLVQGLTSHLTRIYAPYARDVFLNAQIDDLSLDVAAAIPCALIINELVSNSLKYAFPPGRDRPEGERNEIRVEMHKEADARTVLVVGDNGIGLPPDLDWQHPPSLGLQLVKMLTEQLGGTIELDKHAGTVFKITFAHTA